MAVPSSSSSSARFHADFVLCEDLTKPQGLIRTGVGFLDHMIDQLNSHAQIGIALTVVGDDLTSSSSSSSNNNNNSTATSPPDDNNGGEARNHHHNRYASYDQARLLRLVGSTLGLEIKKLLARRIITPTAEELSSSSRFCCPLDESLVVCQLTTTHDRASGGLLQSYNLSPYGKYSRQFIGKLETVHLATFWQSFAQQSGLQIALTKVRGNNAHHIVEASFKAFSRALRNLLDGVDTVEHCATENDSREESRRSNLYGPLSDNWRASVLLQRKGHIERKTKETSISVSLQLDGGAVGSKVLTGIQSLDEFWITLAKEAQCSLQLSCHGDLWIDEHHTAEDVAIAVGQVVNEALGTKAGLNRMWSCQASCGSSTVEATMDLSNRPELHHNLFATISGGEEMVGDLPLEMMEHVLESFVVNARMTVHLVERLASEDHHPMDTVQAVAQALGRAFFYCASVDLRRAGGTASSKGTLSV